MSFAEILHTYESCPHASITDEIGKVKLSETLKSTRRLPTLRRKILQYQLAPIADASPRDGLCKICTSYLVSRFGSIENVLSYIPYRILVAGSREGFTLEEVFAKLSSLPSNSILVSGGARGVDTFAIEYAKIKKIDYQVYKPDWSSGRHAGMLRNIEMVNSGIDFAYIFINNNSKGTAHTISLLNKNNITFFLTKK